MVHDLASAQARMRHPSPRGAERRRPKPMTDPLSDQALVLRAKQGDEIAFSRLVEIHYERAMRVAFGMLKDRGDAEDVTQEAFARVHRRLASFEGSSAFYTWLYRIVVNLSIDLMRKRRRERRVDIEDEHVREALRDASSPWGETEEQDPGVAVQRRQLGEKLQEALEGLPEIHQAVILLREVEGQSYDEIAETLGVKTGTVMSRLFHARKSMQNKLAKVLGRRIRSAAEAME